ncbi:hypothetical protein EDD17DRAFT_541604 [Pisolithus thermaeus]|nr:hypothetical protein EV401DRAFT_372791 [Pisolithus croceorrhizus]KAI6162732.1 hypothetical protein EDD17DRAFT_541604 [Pisolithus thermaeus]
MWHRGYLFLYHSGALANCASEPLVTIGRGDVGSNLLPWHRSHLTKGGPALSTSDGVKGPEGTNLRQYRTGSRLCFPRLSSYLKRVSVPGSCKGNEGGSYQDTVDSGQSRCSSLYLRKVRCKDVGGTVLLKDV